MVGKFQGQKEHLYAGFSLLTAVLAALAGLLALFSFDAQNVPTMAILSGLLVSAYYTAQLHLRLYPNLGRHHSSKEELLMTVGLGGVFGIITLIQWIVPQMVTLGIYLDSATSTVADGVLLFTLSGALS